MKKLTGVLRAYTHLYLLIWDRTKPGYMDGYRDGAHYEDRLKCIDERWLAQPERVARLARLKRMIRMIADEPGCHFFGYEAYRRLYHPGHGQWLKLSELDALADQLTRSLDAAMLGAVAISPAEAFGLLTRALRVHQETGAWPDSVSTRSLIGPVDDINAAPAGDLTLRPQTMLNRLTEIDRNLDDEGCLPAMIQADDVNYGAGSWLQGMLQVYRGQRAGQPLEKIVACSGPTLPAIASDPYFQEDCFKNADLYPEGFTGERICRLCRLQSWSWKPAVVRAATTMPEKDLSDGICRR